MFGLLDTFPFDCEHYSQFSLNEVSFLLLIEDWFPLLVSPSYTIYLVKSALSKLEGHTWKGFVFVLLRAFVLLPLSCFERKLSFTQPLM